MRNSKRYYRIRNRLGEAWKIPEDLLDFWTITGGSEVFETERLLPPLADADGHDEIDQRTQWYQDEGLPASHVVFHEGLGFTALRCADGLRLVSLCV